LPASWENRWKAKGKDRKINTAAENVTFCGGFLFGKSERFYSTKQGKNGVICVIYRDVVDFSQKAGVDNW
jgi:hypothetical protein